MNDDDDDNGFYVNVEYNGPQTVQLRRGRGGRYGTYRDVWLGTCGRPI